MKFTTVIALSLVAIAAAAQTQTKIEKINPFTRVAYVPFGTDLSTIKFDNVKAVKTDTEKVSTWDEYACRETVDGPSAFCPSVNYDKPVPAYRITYYFETITPDDSGDIYSSIEFYLAPSELTPALTAKLAVLKTLSKAERAKLFTLAFNQSPVQKDVVDEVNSKFCDGYYTDSGFTKYDDKCQDQLAYKTITTNPDDVTVVLTPAL
jgi:hypothetical protein